MLRKKHKPEEIVARLRRVDVLLSQGRPAAEAIRTIIVTPFTHGRWRKEFSGLKSNQGEVSSPHRVVRVDSQCIVVSGRQWRCRR